METNKNITIWDGTMTKSSQMEIAEYLVSKIVDGEVNAVQGYAELKAMGEAISMALKDQRVVDVTIREIEKYGKDKPSYQGAVLSIAETGTKYDYSVCGDSVWNELASIKKDCEAKMKEREAFLKHLTPGSQMADATTGELLSCPAKTSTTSIKVQFAK